jgi:hypothetical protein
VWSSRFFSAAKKWGDRPVSSTVCVTVRAAAGTAGAVNIAVNNGMNARKARRDSPDAASCRFARRPDCCVRHGRSSLWVSGNDSMSRCNRDALGH